jgi:hypothetical protein
MPDPIPLAATLTENKPLPDRLNAKAAVIVFLAFAAAYFCSALLRAITATLAPVLTQEFSLQARDLGLLAAMIVLSMAGIAWVVPRWRPASALASLPSSPPATAPQEAGYAPIWRSRYFRKMAPLAFFNYGGMLAIQTLWAGPWMGGVNGQTPLASATGLFYINASMLVTFWSWGMLSPWLARNGWNATRLIAWGTPLSLAVLAFNILAGTSTGWLGWALFCVTSSVMGLAQPAVGMSFRAALAGRALSAYNLVIFSGVFAAQWSLGLLIDGFAALGLGPVASFQAAMAVFLCCCIAAYGCFISLKADNSPQ